MEFSIEKDGNKLWFNIHQDTYLADQYPNMRKNIIELLKFKFENFSCSKCKPHLLQYLKDNPLEKSNSLFKWSWEFHNAVNRRIGKLEMDYETAYMSVSNQNQCDSCKTETKSNDTSIPFDFQSRSNPPTQNNLITQETKSKITFLKRKKG